MDSPPNYPDGLTRAVIDALVTEAAKAAQPVYGMPPLFADRDAALQREHRRAHRTVARTALSLAVPVAPQGEQAA